MLIMNKSLQNIFFGTLLIASFLFYVNTDGRIDTVIRTALLLVAFFGFIVRLSEKSISRHELVMLVSIIFMVSLMLLSYVVNQNIERIYGEVLTFFLYVYIFIVLYHYRLLQHHKIAIYLFLYTYTLAPLLLLLAGVMTYDSLSGFYGFAVNRNHYGILTGFSVLIAVIYFKNKPAKIIFFICLMYSLWLSGSRGAIIALFISLFYFFNSNYRFCIKKVFINLVFFLMLFLLYYLYLEFMSQGRGDAFRLFIVDIYMESIVHNFLFGVGYNLYFNLGKEGFSEIYAHNFILQIIANYGFYVFIAYCWMFLLFFKKISKSSRALLIYIFIVGSFQPLFDVRFNAFYFLSLLILMFFENTNKKSVHG